MVGCEDSFHIYLLFFKKQRYDVSIHDYYTIYFIGDRKSFLLFSFQIFAVKTKCRDLLVGHYS